MNCLTGLSSSVRAILSDPTTHFTEDIMHQLDLAAETEFKYGAGNEETIQDSDD